MEKQSKSLLGIWAKLEEDVWTAFQLKVMKLAHLIGLKENYKMC